MNMSGIVVSRFRTAEDAAEFANTNENRINFAIENRALAADYYWCYEREVVGETLEDIPIYEPSSQPKVIIDDGYQEYEEVEEVEDEDEDEDELKEKIEEKMNIETVNEVFIMAQKQQFEYIIKMGKTVKLSIDGTTAEFKGTVKMEDGFIIVEGNE